MSERSDRRPFGRRLYESRAFGHPLRVLAALLMLPRRLWNLQRAGAELEDRVRALEAGGAGRTSAPGEEPGANKPPRLLVGVSDNADIAAALRDAGPELARALVEEVFQGLLGRSPGPQGAETYPRRLREGLALRELIAELVARPEFPRPPRRSEYFDSERYLADHPDIAVGDLDPLEHYVRFGRKEGRAAFDLEGARIDPPGSFSDYFDGERYLRDHSDLGGAVNPLDHYLRFGRWEGRQAYGRNGTRIEPPDRPVPESSLSEAPAPAEIEGDIYLGRWEQESRERKDAFGETMRYRGLTEAILALEEQ